MASSKPSLTNTAGESRETGRTPSRSHAFPDSFTVPARRAVARFSTRYSRKRSTVRQRVVLLSQSQRRDRTGSAYDHHWYWRAPHDGLRDALQKDSCRSVPSMCSHDNRIRIVLFGILDSPMGGLATTRPWLPDRRLSCGRRVVAMLIFVFSGGTWVGGITARVERAPSSVSLIDG